MQALRCALIDFFWWSEVVKKLYEAIVKKISHDHEFKLIEETQRFFINGNRPISIIKVYMCRCGKVKKIEIN